MGAVDKINKLLEEKGILNEGKETIKTSDKNKLLAKKLIQQLISDSDLMQSYVEIVYDKLVDAKENGISIDDLNYAIANIKYHQDDDEEIAAIAIIKNNLTPKSWKLLE
jgi:hypothetical protein